MENYFKELNEYNKKNGEDSVPLECRENEGAIFSLVNKGSQDKFISENKELYKDFREKYLTTIHQFAYQKLDFVEAWTERKYLTLQLNRTCDLINNVDIMFEKDININVDIKSIGVELGGQRIDILNSNDLETQILTSCKLFNRAIHKINNKTFIPIVISPFLDKMAIMPSNFYHDARIIIEFHKSQLEKYNIELYANCYYLEQSMRDYITNTNQELILPQSQSTSNYSFIKDSKVNKINKGTNTIKLWFNHPMYLIYFWGFDKTKVTNVKLIFNKEYIFYDGSIEALIHLQRTRGISEEYPTFLYFSQDELGTLTKSSVNFSRIDHAELVIESTQEDESDIHIVGINMQPIRSEGGMYGLRFSK